MTNCADCAGYHFEPGRHIHSWDGVNIPGVTSIIKAQETLIGGDLAVWGGGLVYDYLSQFVDREPLPDRESALAAVTAKRDLGSKVHEDIERLLAGQRADPTPETAPYLYAYASFLAAERPEFLAVERPVVNLTARYAGKFDFIARFPLRGNRIGMTDTKTGALRLTTKLQLAAYSAAEGIATEGSTDLEPLPDVEAHYVLLLRPEGYELVDLAVDDADRAHFLDLVANYHRMKAWDRQAAFLKEAA